MISDVRVSRVARYFDLKKPWACRRRRKGFRSVNKFIFRALNASKLQRHNLLRLRNLVRRNHRQIRYHRCANAARYEMGRVKRGRGQAGQRTDLPTDRPTNGIRSKTTTASDRKSVATGRFGLANQSISQSVHYSISQFTNQQISQSANKPISQSVNQSISQSVKQSNSQAVKQSSSQSVNQSIIQSVNQLIS